MKKLIVISESYPYSTGEDWMYKELKEAEEYYDQIVIFPLSRDERPARLLSPKCILKEDLILTNQRISNIYLVRHAFAVCSIFITELVRNPRSSFLVKKNRFFSAQIKLAMLRAEIFRRVSQDYITPADRVHYYSVWLNNGALIMALLKRKSKLPNFFVRLHGYDLYDERREGKYMPFRAFCFKHADRVFVLSATGTAYTKSKNIYPEKLR